MSAHNRQKSEDSIMNWADKIWTINWTEKFHVPTLPENNYFTIIYFMLKMGCSYISGTI